MIAHAKDKVGCAGVRIAKVDCLRALAREDPLGEARGREARRWLCVIEVQLRSQTGMLQCAKVGAALLVNARRLVIDGVLRALSLHRLRAAC